MLRPVLGSMDELRALGAVPRVHPNGFIQLDLDDVHRLHVWHPDLPYRQKTYHPVHDHVFSFTSFCFSGRLVHVVYDVLESGFCAQPYFVAWACHAVGPQESVLRPVDGVERVLVFKSARALQPGGHYWFDAFRFHETLSNEPTLTIMQKHDATIYQGNERRPTVMVPVGVEPDNDFRRDDVDAAVLWDLIAEAHPS